MYPTQNFTYADNSEKATTIRQPSSALLLIDSQDRYPFASSGKYDNTFEININNFLINHSKILGLGQIKRMALTEINFPWTTPNINERNNNFFLKDVQTEQYYYFYVPEGFYTPNELANTLSTLANGQNWIDSTGNKVSWGKWEITYNETNLYFVIKSDTEFKTSTSYPQSNQQITNLMNIADITSSPLDPPDKDYNQILTGGLPYMTYTRYIDICSKTLTKYQNVKDTLTQFNYNDIVYRLYLDNPINTPNTYFGTRPCINLYRQIQNPKYIQWNENEMLNTIDIQLYDDAGELLYVPQKNWNFNFLLTIQMSES